jgi:hypothetical protein
MGKIFVSAGSEFLLIAIVLLGSTAHVAASCPSPEALKATSLDRTFVQEKHLSGMEQPLISEGRMTAQQDEIVWHMLKPFDVKTIIGPSGISQSVAGAEATIVTTGNGQVAGSVARSMAAVMRGEWKALNSLFDVDMSAARGDSDWTVGLTPHDDRLKSVMGEIKVRGCEDVSTVDFGDPKGDREHIQFGPVAP